jgi:hypothetical protein
MLHKFKNKFLAIMVLIEIQLILERLKTTMVYGRRTVK